MAIKVCIEGDNTWTCKLNLDLRGDIGDGGAPYSKRLNGATSVCGEMGQIYSGTNVFGKIQIE